jgi:Protein of unknown function (DUF3828)
MKNVLITLLCLVTFVTACKNNAETKNTATTETKAAASPANADNTAITETLHGFFTWYSANDERIGKINFVNETGKHLALDEKQLTVYHAEVKKSGFVSDEFIADEIKFYKACSKSWEEETKGEVPTGMGADRYLCAQDFIAPYNTGTVTSVINGDRAKATLTLKGEQGEKSDFTFDMKKEGGKWLLAKLGCDMGVKY